MPAAMPVIDASTFTTYSETERNQYHSYPYWLYSYIQKKRRTWNSHSDKIGKKAWTPNHGDTLRAIRKEPSPNVRQEFTPREFNQTPKKDIVDVWEPATEATLKIHHFESRVFDVIPSFVDFMKDHVKATTVDLAEKLERAYDIFVRTGVFHMSPNIFVANNKDGAGNEVVASPMWDGKDMSQIPVETTEGTAGKTIAFRQAMAAKVGNPGNLTLVNCFLADSYMREEIRAMPYSGGYNKPGDNSAIQGMNCLVLSNEAYNQFRFDPFVLPYKNLSLDLIKMGYNGAISDNIVCKVEDLPLRMLGDGTFPRPETRELNADAYNLGETTTLSAYNQAPYEWAFLYADAASAYQSLEVGPPPAEFNSSNIEANDFKKLVWNGEIRLTKDLLLPVELDASLTAPSGIATGWDTNRYGRKMQAICEASFGIVGIQRRWVLPILFKRRRGIAQ